MKPITFLCPTLALFVAAPSIAQLAQPTRVFGSVDQTSSINVLASTAIGFEARASVLANAVLEGVRVAGDVRQTSSGGARIAVALSPYSKASITEASICGSVANGAKLTSHVKSATVLTWRPGASSSIEIANVGRRGAARGNSFVSAGHLVAIEGIPFVKSNIRIGSTGGRC